MFKPKIIVVDDELDILEIFTHLFSRDFTVFTAKNGIEALEIVKREVPHLVITDIKMPEMNGVELLGRIKEVSPSTEVIMMTGYASIETSVDALRFGAFDYLIKPFESIEQIKNVIAKAINKIKATSEVKIKQEELRKRAFELSSLYDISKAVSNFVSYEELFSLTVNTLYNIIKYDAAGAFFFDEGKKFVIKIRENLPESYIENLKSNLIKSYSTKTDENISFMIETKIDKGSIKSVKNQVETFISEPVIVTNKIIAVLFITSGIKNAFSEEEKKLLHSIANHTSIEINKMSSIFSTDQKKIQTVLDSLSNGVIMINKNYELVMLNPSAKEILASMDITLPKEWGKNKCDCIICDSIEKIYLDKNTPVSASLEKDGYFSIYANSITEQDGNLSGIIIVLKDLTKEKQLEHQLIQVEKLSSVGQLISGVAHELNNPLTGVLGYAELLIKSNIDSSIKDDLEKISTQAERCRKIIQNLLSFVRKHKVEMAQVDINHIILNSLTLREYELGVHNIIIKKNLTEKLPSVMGDSHQIQQVILNLLINAEQAIIKSGKGNNITVETCSRNNIIEITFKDNGPGITKENQLKIFEPFFTTKEKGEGTGLGLSISRGIIEDHGGTIDVFSKEGEGTCFTIELPVYKDYAEIKEEEIKPIEITLESQKHKKIMVVDDEPIILDMVTNVLEDMEHNITTSDSGEEALEKIAEHQDFDLIILDMKMPGLGGKELYFIIKEKFPHLSDKIIFSTGDIINPYTRSFLEEIGNRYLEKPFLLSRFQQVIQEVLYEK